MLRVTVEVIPRGNEDLKRVIAVGEIANVSMLSGFTGEYVAFFREDPFRGTRRGPYSRHLQNVNQHAIGTPDRRAKGTPLIGCFAGDQGSP
jgi:hypothetical protein